MTTLELQSEISNATYSAKAKVSPGGDIELMTSDTVGSAYGPVEIVWYPDRLEITAVGAGRALITKGHLHRTGDAIVQIRPPTMDELTEAVPGAD